VLPALKKWTLQGLKVGVYSSGSIVAQKLIFGYSEAGDLSGYFSHHFDTSMGFKKDRASYERIAQTLMLSPADILFLSDMEAELDAAQSVGFQTIQLIRLGTTPSLKHQTVQDFGQIEI
jgi:enolase-phosphatase E1